jgi:hypothetical protein
VGRATALLGLFVVLFAYDDLAPHLWHQGVWGDVVWIAFVLMPATFGLVLLALPLVRRDVMQLALVGLSFIALTLALAVAHANVSANYTRLAAATLIAWAFIQVFETAGQVVLVAAIIPWVDIYSVANGPTKTITQHHPKVFQDLSFAFLAPGKHAAANLGVPDLLFFAFFLGAAYRFRLRVLPTFIGMLAGLAITFVLVQWTGADGLPALPGISAGFLAPNADLLWQQLRRKPRVGDGTDVPLDGTADGG